jgi:hypothetical protein
MASKKKKAGTDTLPLPGVPQNVAASRTVYRVDDGDVQQSAIDAVLAGRADLDRYNHDQFELLMRVLVELRRRSFDLAFDVYDGNTCGMVRRNLKAMRPSEIARAIVGAGRDPYTKKRKPPLAVILQRVPELMELADDSAPPPPRLRADVVADYLRLHPIAFDVDWHQRWPAVDDIEKTTVPMMEHYITQMRAAIRASRLSVVEKKRALGDG